MKKKFIIIILLVLIITGIVATQITYLPLSTDSAPRLFFSLNQADLRRVSKNAVQQAKKKIDLRLYACTDTTLLNLLQKKALEGLSIVIEHDLSTSQQGFNLLTPPIERHGVSLKGLMHQKILIVDTEYVWIGSANWTSDSLAVNENDLIGFYSPEFALSLLKKQPLESFWVNGQLLEYYEQPSAKSLMRLLQMLSEAKAHIRIALYALSHPLLVQACLNAYHRGVKIDIILDRHMSLSVSKKALAHLTQYPLSARLYRGMGILHHKLAWIDDQLVIGSTNWTQAAFKYNQDCMLIIHNLQPKQERQLKRFWKTLMATSQNASS